VTRPGAGGPGCELAVAGGERLAGRADSRAADFSHLGPFLLGQSPGAVLLCLDLHRSRDPEMKIDLAPECFPMTVSIDETRQHGLAAHIDDVAATRDIHFTTPSNCLESIS